MNLYIKYTTCFLLIGLIKFFYAYAYDIKTSTIEEDWAELERQEIESDYPEYAAKLNAAYLAEQIANKWFEQGDSEDALQFIEMTLNLYPEGSFLSRKDYAEKLAKKWYKRGAKEIALKIDMMVNVNDPDLEGTLAQLWNLRGGLEAVKWVFETFPPYDIKTSSFGRDTWESILYPDLLDRIADKWYNKGDKQEAERFDFYYALYDPEKLDEILTKWNDRGEGEIAFNIKQSFEKVRYSPESIESKFNKLIKRGKLAEAEKFGKKALEYWTSQNDQDILEYADIKLKLAAKLNDEYYYDILIGKLKNKNKMDNILYDYSKYLKSLSLSPSMKDISITDYLIHRSYIAPDFLKTYKISIEEARMMLETDIYELAKKSDITFSVLHVIALHAKEDPFSKIYIFPPDWNGNNGEYHFDLGIVRVNNSQLGSRLMRRVLAHEWTHQAMNILFNNDSRPYPQDDEVMIDEWKDAFDSVESAFRQSKRLISRNSQNPYSEASVSFDDISSYESRFHDSEAIARFVELIGSDAYNDPAVQEVLGPIYDYWMKYIEPAIQKYVKDRSAIDTFLSDWERENILDSFYRAKLGN